MKKILLILLSVILLLVVAAVAIPFLFKDKIVQMVKVKANEQLVATVNFDNDIGLSLFKSFPDISLTIRDLSITGLDTFAGDTLLSMKEFSATLDVMSVISGDQIKVKSVLLDKPYIHAIVLQNGKANWDITKPDDAVDTSAADTAGGEFKVALKKYEIRDAHVIYDDRQGNMYAELKNFNHIGKGDFTQDVFLLETNTTADEITYKMDGLPYLSRVKTELRCDLEMNLPAMKFTFKENYLRLNDLEIGMDGFVELPTEDINMDLKLFTKKTEFKNILSLVPAVFTKDFDKVKSSGKLALNAMAKGVLNTDREKYPAFDLKLLIENGMFQYPDLPSSLNNVQVNLAVNNPDGVLNNTVINLSRMHFEFGKEPFDLKLLVKYPMTDPLLDAEAKGKVVLDNISKMIPLEAGTSIKGTIEADLVAKGVVSTLTSGNYENFAASGFIAAQQVQYASADLPAAFLLNNARLDFTPAVVSMPVFDAKIGNSDVQMKGEVSNFFGYALRNELLKGRLEVRSTLLDANQFLSNETTTAKTAPAPADTIPLEVFEVPANMELDLDLAIGKLLYDNLVLDNISGKAQVKNQALLLNNLNTGILGGTALFNGYYDSKNPLNPQASLKMKIQEIDIKQSFLYLTSVKAMLPVAQYLTGKVSADFTLKTLLDKHMSPVINTLTSEGSFRTSEAVLSNFTPLLKLADQLNMDQLRNVALTSTNISYEIHDGRFHIKSPITQKIGPVTLNVEKDGSTGFDQTLDYKLKLAVPRSAFGQANNALSGLLAEAGKKGAEIKMSEIINVNALVGGTISNPVIKTSMNELKKDLLDQGKQLLDEKKKEVIEKVDAQAQKFIDDASKKGDQLIAEAQKQADALRAEAKKQGDQLIAEADKQAENLLKEAGSNPLKKVAAQKGGDKLKSEARKTADQLNQEADKKGNQVVDKAKTQKEQLIRDAEARKNSVK